MSVAVGARQRRARRSDVCLLSLSGGKNHGHERRARRRFALARPYARPYGGPTFGVSMCELFEGAAEEGGEVGVGAEVFARGLRGALGACRLIAEVDQG